MTDSQELIGVILELRELIASPDELSLVDLEYAHLLLLNAEQVFRKSLIPESTLERKNKHASITSISTSNA